MHSCRQIIFAAPLSNFLVLFVCFFVWFLRNLCLYPSVPLSLLTAKEMRNITNRFRLGFGGFVDKPVAPYIATEPAA